MTSVPAPLAFSPGSITCFFLPRRRPEPAETASLGCAINIHHGVTAALRPGPSAGTWLNGEPADLPTVRRVLEALAPEPLHVFLETPLPIGCGFGVSAAAALSTAFAIDRRFALQRSRAELGLIAHVAEVGQHTGIGDVAAQLCGGVVYRRCQAGPLDAVRIPVAAPPLYYRAFGPLATASVLGSPTLGAAIGREGERAVEWLAARYEGLTLEAIFARSREFTEQVGLLQDPRVIGALHEINELKGSAMMILLGQSVLSTRPGKDAAAWTPCTIDPYGTRCLP